jgi:peptide subunit release factor 1 (eRF1)
MLETPIAQAAERLDAERDAALVEKVLEATRGGIRGSVGAQETEAALAEARVETLVLDCGVSASRETMVRSALQSGAQVAAVSGEAAEKLASGDGVAALLRY